MAKLYIHHVGAKGSEDFNKTVFKSIEIESLKPYIDESLIVALLKEFPNGKCNAWGVPAAAENTIASLDRGDFFLLIGKTERTPEGGMEGDIPILCSVKLFVRELLPNLSRVLWGDLHFPLVFFFKTEELNDYTWLQMIREFRYDPKFRLQGLVMAVKSDRLDLLGGTEHYINQLRLNFGKISQQDLQEDVSTEDEKIVSTEEVEQAAKYISTQLSEEPELTDNVARKTYLVSRPARSLVFKRIIRQNYDESCAICGLRLKSPLGHPEVQGAHIFPRAKNGSDDPRNGLALCSIHHWALDVGWIALSDDYQILVHSRLPRDKDYEIIWRYEGKQIQLPRDKNLLPSRIYLMAHRQEHGFK